MLNLSDNLLQWTRRSQPNTSNPKAPLPRYGIGSVSTVITNSICKICAQHTFLISVKRRQKTFVYDYSHDPVLHFIYNEKRLLTITVGSVSEWKDSTSPSGYTTTRPRDLHLVFQLDIHELLTQFLLDSFKFVFVAYMSLCCSNLARLLGRYIEACCR
jgi:hypothetical protein